VRKNLVVDGGFDHGLTRTSTRWEAFVGFTYLLPHRLWSAHRGDDSPWCGLFSIRRDLSVSRAICPLLSS
jgi:hypothetical protein